jgi:tetratricopeptide (TPR) repeat protein
LEEHLKDTDRATSAYEKVVDLTQEPSAMEALARLSASKNKWTHAASWLKAHLAVAKPQERVSVLLRLARIQLRLGQNESAVDTLEQAFEEAPKHQEIRGLLLDQYRNLENYEALAQTLSRVAQHLSTPSMVLSYTEEAADIYFYKLHVVRKAVSVLSRAVELAPEEQRFKVMLAEALVADSQYDRAETLLSELLEGFGRRRSPERGAIHLQLALVAKAQGRIDAAMEQLDLALSMDTKNAVAGKVLAETARDAGDKERAERAYRGLLLLVRRETQKEGESPVIFPSEILFELSFLAAERD